jgi:hypothetical protein
MRIAWVSIARVPYEAEKAPPKRGCQVGGNAVPKGDQHWLAESSKNVQIDFAYIPILSARSSRPLGNGQENGFAGSRTAAQTLSIFSIYEVKGRGVAHGPAVANDATLVIERIVAVELVKILSFFTSGHRPRTDDQYIIARHSWFLSSSDTSSPPLTQAMLVSTRT